MGCDGAALRAAVSPKCKPFGSSHTQRPVYTHARPAPPAGACLSPPRSQQLKMDVISRTPCARTRAHNALSRRRCWHTRTSLDISLLRSLRGTCFPAPGSLLALLHLFFATFLLSFPPSPNPGLPHPPRTALWGPSPSPRDGEGAAETRPARAEQGPCCARGRHRRAGLWHAPCLFSLRPLNARLRRKDYRGRIMPGVNTRANKSACTTPPTPLGPGPRGWGKERVPRC